MTARLNQNPRAQLDAKAYVNFVYKQFTILARGLEEHNLGHEKAGILLRMAESTGAWTKFFNLPMIIMKDLQQAVERMITSHNEAFNQEPRVWWLFLNGAND